MNDLDGFVAAVPRANKAAYLKHAEDTHEFVQAHAL